MEENRSVASVLMVHSKKVTDELLIKRALPSPEMRRIDPFLLLDHIGPMKLEPNHSIVLPPHPHRGFEPVSLLLEGRIEHRHGREKPEKLFPGDVHWITAGSGMIHSEKFMEYEPGFGGIFHCIQLWVNLPSRLKLCQPATQCINSSNIPVINEDDGNILIRVIAGDLYGQSGPARTHVPLFAAHVRMQPGSRSVFPIHYAFNAFLYVIVGSVKINEDTRGQEQSLVTMKNNGVGIEIEAEVKSELLLLGGMPINEPVASCGPFVMNKYQEVQQAIQDYEAGRLDPSSS